MSGGRDIRAMWVSTEHSVAEGPGNRVCVCICMGKLVEHASLKIGHLGLDL